MGSGRGDRRRRRWSTWSRRGEKVGVLKVRLYRPFSAEHFFAALPADGADASPCSTGPRSPGSVGEPLYLDVVAAMSEAVALGRVASSRRCRASSAGATGSGPRSSRRPW